MPSFAESLNSHIEPLLQAVNDGYVPIEYVGLTEGFTGFDSQTPDAFLLNPPVAGMVRDLRTHPGIALELQPEGDRFILRAVFGYSLAARFINQPYWGILGLSNIINYMVSSAYKVYGPRVQKLTFNRPGFGPNISELENNAGYEIRLYGELSNPAVIEFEMETVE